YSILQMVSLLQINALSNGNYRNFTTANGPCDKFPFLVRRTETIVANLTNAGSISLFRISVLVVTTGLVARIGSLDKRKSESDYVDTEYDYNIDIRTYVAVLW
ncbi:MAG: hypothetical protein M3Y53_12350, partial [Thermoproteota archaeon]|nr:hypothetical protein [Thermoproteota archaeon]